MNDLIRRHRKSCIQNYEGIERALFDTKTVINNSFVFRLSIDKNDSNIAKMFGTCKLFPRPEDMVESGSHKATRLPLSFGNMRRGSERTLSSRASRGNVNTRRF